MTPADDNITSFIIAGVFLAMAAIMFYEAGQAEPRANAGFITGLAALIVGIIYCIPLFFDVRVVDLRGVLRIALIVYGANYIISHYQSLFSLGRGLIGRVKAWKFHRS